MAHNGGYDRGLLDNVPAPSRGQKQEGYDVNLLARRSPENSTPNVAQVSGPSTDHDPEPGAVYGEKLAPRANGGTARPTSFWQSTRGRLVIGLIALVVVAAIVGGAVGGTVGHHKKNNNTSSLSLGASASPTSTSASAAATTSLPLSAPASTPSSVPPSGAAPNSSSSISVGPTSLSGIPDSAKPSATSTSITEAF